MSSPVTRLLQVCAPDDAAWRDQLYWRFGWQCVERVRHLLEDERAVAGLDLLKAYVAGSVDRATLQTASQLLQDVARSHAGSRSIDGSAHAAVSATFAVAHAMAGRAAQAADYAAYAAVYAYGGYAVSDPSAFEPEHSWQVACLQALVETAPATA